MNATVGNLRTFLDAIKGGKVAPGSALIVESIDRISRQGIDEGYDLVKSILKAGVKIVTLSPEREFDRDATKSLSKGALEIQLILERAAEESERKSDRIGSAWAKKQQEAGAKAVTRRVPGWIVAVGGEGKRIKETAPGEVRYKLHPEKSAVVRRMFREAVGGDGATTIAKKLNGEGVPTIGRSMMRGKPVMWANVTVYHILTSRACIGEYTPYAADGKKPAGEPVPNYYPPVVDEATFYKAQAAIKTRATCGRGRRGKHVNLFAGLLVDARDGGPMTYCHRKRSSAVVMPAGAKQGMGATWTSIPANALENAILTMLAELTAKDVADTDTDAAKKLKAAEGRVAKVETLREAWRAKMDDVRIVNTVAAKLVELEGEYREAVEERNTARRELAAPAADAIDEVNTLADLLAKDNSAETRLKVRAALRQCIESVTLLNVSVAQKTRHAAARVQFKGGNHRDYFIVTRSEVGGACAQEGTWAAESFATAGLPTDADLRDPKQAKKLEALLVRHTAKK
jgi:DNA invertase Pin-like site-specific DNA recombinase